MNEYNAHKLRLNRFLGADGRCLDVAIDHGIFNELSFLDGLEDMHAVVKSLVDAGPDAIQMNFGQADILQSIPGKHKPALVMRMDVGNPYNAVGHKFMYNQPVVDVDPVLPAVQMDAACVVVNLLLLPNEPELHRQTVSNVGRIRHFCDTYRMPLMVEPLVMKAHDGRDGYQVDGNKRLIVPLVRQARELGADIIKADPTEHPEDYHEVVAAARCPVLVRGGGKKPLETVFAEAHAFLQQGAKGLVYGRNIYQHPNPNRIVAAFMAMIHQGADASEATAIYHGEKSKSPT